MTTNYRGSQSPAHAGCRHIGSSVFVCQVVLTCALLVLLSRSATAAVFQWDGGGANTNWGTAANWTSSAPSSNDQNDLVFGGVALVSPSQTTANNNITNDFNVNSLTFSGTAGASFNLTGQSLEFKKDGSTQATLVQSSNLAHSISNSIKVGGDNFTLTGNGTGIVTISGSISGGKPLFKTGTSTYLLTANNNQLNETTTINGGTIIVGNNNALDTNEDIVVNNTGTLAINTGLNYSRTATFNNGSTLAGKGTYSPGGTFGNNVTIAPGIGDIGTLTVGSTTFDDGSVFAVEVGAGANNNDRLNASGNLDTNHANTLALSMSGADQGKYTIASASGTFTTHVNVFGTVTGLNSAYRVNANTSAKAIELIHKATIGIDVSPAAAQMITGGSVNFIGHVANLAPADSDPLSYTLGGSTGVSGLPGGTLNRTAGDANAAAGALYNGSFTSTTLGSNLVQITATGTNAGTVSNSPQNASFSVEVLDHADGSFAGPGDADLNIIELVFNLIAGDSDSQSYSLSNLAGDRAGLEFLSVTESGDDDDTAAAGFFQNDIAAFGTLAAGSATALFNVWFDASSLAAGTYQTTYLLNLTDQALPGALGQSLTINVTGNVTALVVVPVPATLPLLAAGGMALCLVGWRRR